VALVVDGSPVVGAVAVPARGIVVTTGAAQPSAVLRTGQLCIAISRTRPPGFITAVAATLGATLLPLGSVGVKTLAVISGDADIYLHAGGQYEWDSAAPVAIAVAAGLHASRIDGTPLQYNRASPWLPDILICRPEIAARTLAAVQGAQP
jgi:3'(2'), 5'-bisphosphate nucleotidase